jgi:hypothetical protein
MTSRSETHVLVGNCSLPCPNTAHLSFTYILKLHFLGLIHVNDNYRNYLFIQYPVQSSHSFLTRSFHILANACSRIDAVSTEPEFVVSEPCTLRKPVACHLLHDRRFLVHSQSVVRFSDSLLPCGHFLVDPLRLAGLRRLEGMAL